MRDVDVLLSKLLRETLAQRAGAKLARRERAREDVAADSGRRAREDERAPLPALVERILPELEDGTAREREGRVHVHLQRVRDVLLGHIEEAFEHARSGVPHPDAELRRPPRGPLVREDGVEDGERRVVGVVRNREGCRL